MTSSRHGSDDVNPAADVIAERRRHYLARAQSADAQERRVAQAQLARLERLDVPKAPSASRPPTGIDLAALIGETVSLREKGSGKLVGPCPWHSSRSGECLVVWIDEGRWWCSSCKRGGDGVAWVAFLEGIGFRQARQRLGLSALAGRPENRSWAERIHAATTSREGRHDG